MQNSSFENESSLVVSKETFNEIIRFKHEVLLCVNELLLNNDSLVSKSYLNSLNSSEIYYYLEYHQKILINFLYFKDLNILKHFIKWTYRVNHHKDIDLEVFLLQYELWKSSFSKYFSSTNLFEITQIYDFLIQNHNSFVQEAINTSHTITYANTLLIDEIYEFAIKSNKDEVLKLCVDKCKDVDEFAIFFDTVLSKVMEKVGLMWESSQINVASEHIASSTIENVCLELINSFDKSEAKNIVVLLSNAPNEYHGMGLKILGKVLEKKGYDVISLGSSGSPSKDIVNSIINFHPNFILFGVSICTNLYDVADIIKMVRVKTSFSNKVKIVVGGNALEYLSNPKKSMNSDYYSNKINNIIEVIEAE